MTMTISGTVGVDFNITETDTALPTGNIIQVHRVNPEIESLEVESTDLVASVNGNVGEDEITLDLLDLKTTSSSNGLLTVVRNNNVIFSAMKSLVFHNISSSGNVELRGLTNSFLTIGGTADPHILIEPGMSLQFTFSSKPVSAIARLIDLAGTINSVDLEIYFLGN